MQAKSVHTKKNWQWVKTPAAKKLFSVSRWLHIYLSTALFSLLLFFCITGIFLNHLDWFESVDEQKSLTIQLPESLLTVISKTHSPAEVIEQFIEQTQNLNNPRKINIDKEMNEITYDYPLPAGYAFVTVMLEESIMEIEYQRGTLIALLNDLHKGRHTGKQWSLIIDLSAIIISLFAITGIIILLQQIKWRKSGILLIIAGTLLPVCVYLVFVPSF
ncbi:PepSY-associated TM helix domain-containing protein [Aliikangiella sp. IMCC44359]|uniref:PepSY-associated TM helix domain-containing protein n=1 Tax=Aliikangiella sp. IMCC44359 TaxID=3459125 RepID=UPI00403ABC0D